MLLRSTLPRRALVPVLACVLVCVKACVLVCGLIAGLGYASAAAAQIYRWVDENGKVHFSDEKPVDKAADVVQPAIADPAPEPDEGELRRRSYLESANDPRYTPPPKSTPRQNSDIDPERCRRARVEYGILDEPVPAYRTATGELRASWSNDTHKGERRYIKDSERRAEQQAAWARMHQYCEDPQDQTAYVDAWNDYVDRVFCDEHQARLEHARTPRARTPRGDLERMEAEYRRNCS
ncbi:MAG: DUF4124 domain-containing protein [Pseudomonadales bacterium]